MVQDFLVQPQWWKPPQTKHRILNSAKHQRRSSSAKTVIVSCFRKKALPQTSSWIPYMDPTRSTINLRREGGGGGGGVDWKCMALVATDFFCCLSTLDRPVAKMSWAYLFSKNI